MRGHDPERGGSAEREDNGAKRRSAADRSGNARAEEYAGVLVRRIFLRVSDG